MDSTAMAAADQYRGFAKDAEEKVFVTHYEQLATQAAAAAAGLEAEADRLQDVQKQVAKKLNFLAEAATFLDCRKACQSGEDYRDQQADTFPYPRRPALDVGEFFTL